MKKIYLLVVKAFIRPFIVTFFIVMFVLLMLWLFKYIDDLIGKGFEISLLAKLIWYASATNVAMALPLAMLLSSIMTFGALGENYELVAIKSAGVSLQKAMAPLVVVVCLLSVAAFLFSDYMLPRINQKMGYLLYNARSQKPAFLIKEGVFNDSFPNYSIRVNKKDEDKGTLHDILIYDHTKPNGNIVTLMADDGKMYVTTDRKYLVLKLQKGVRYEEKASEKTGNPKQQFLRQQFSETEVKFDLGVFDMQQVPEDAFSGNYMMLNIKRLKHNRDSVRVELDSSRKNSFAKIQPNLGFYYGNGKYVKKNLKKVKKYQKNAVELIPAGFRNTAIQGALSESDRMIQSLTDIDIRQEDLATVIRRYTIEFQRKYTLAFSCLILFSIGAPLGAIIRKGGLGMPVVMAIIFFLIYHIISTIAEKSAKEGSLNPIFGMWLAIIVLAPLGVFLTYKATVDSSLFNIDNYKQALTNLFKKKKAG